MSLFMNKLVTVLEAQEDDKEKEETTEDYTEKIEDEEEDTPATEDYTEDIETEDESDEPETLMVEAEDYTGDIEEPEEFEEGETEEVEPEEETDDVSEDYTEGVDSEEDQTEDEPSDESEDEEPTSDDSQKEDEDDGSEENDTDINLDKSEARNMYELSDDYINLHNATIGFIERVESVDKSNIHVSVAMNRIHNNLLRLKQAIWNHIVYDFYTIKYIANLYKYNQFIMALKAILKMLKKTGEFINYNQKH